MNRTDNFNRADSNTALGTPSDAGSDWVALVGTWGVVSNGAYSVTGTAGNHAYLEASLADVDVRVTLKQQAVGGITFRVVDADDYLLMVWYGASFNTIELYKVVSGTPTKLGSTATSTFNTGDVMKVVANGDSISAYKNDVLMVGPVTESQNQAATKHGIYSSNDPGTWLDDFSITGVGGGGGSILPLVARGLVDMADTAGMRS